MEASSGKYAQYDAFYARFLEEGTVHIGASRFLERSLETTREEAIEAFNNAIIRELTL